MDSENNLEQIDLIPILGRCWKAFKTMWILVVVLAVVSGGFFYFRARQSFRPQYEAKAVFSVNSGVGSDNVFTSSQYYDSAAAKSMAESFSHLVGTDVMRDLVMSRLNTSYINGTITAKLVAENSNLLQMTVRSSRAQDAYDILLAVIDVYPDVAVYMVDNPQIIMRENPSVPTTPCNRFSGTGSLVKGIALGLILGLILVFLKAMTSRTIDSVDALKKVVNLPLLATLPHVIVKKRRSVNRSFINSDDDRALAEALRSLRVKVRRQLADKNGQTVLLTSTVPGEGKSTICANLALSLAQEGHTVVLLDADLRNQTICRMFGTGRSQKGLIDCLRDPGLNVENCLSPVPGTNLWYLSGQSTRKRHYSIDAKALRRVLESLQERFDYVVVDSPPCGVVSDTTLFGRYADCVVYVVRQDHAVEAQILDAIESLYQRDIPLTGCILNDVPRRRIPRGYGYGYGYGYGQKKEKA